MTRKEIKIVIIVNVSNTMYVYRQNVNFKNVCFDFHGFCLPFSILLLQTILIKLYLFFSLIPVHDFLNFGFDFNFLNILCQSN